jgi:hypothetical protein
VQREKRTTARLATAAPAGRHAGGARRGCRAHPSPSPRRLLLLLRLRPARPPWRAAPGSSSWPRRTLPP